MLNLNTRQIACTGLLIFLLVGCSGATVEDEPDASSDANTDTAEDVRADMGERADTAEAPDTAGPSCSVPFSLEYPDPLRVELDFNEDHPNTLPLHDHGAFDFVATVESATADEARSTIALVLEHEHRIWVRIPKTPGITLALPPVGDEVKGSFACSYNVFCASYAVSIRSMADQLLFEGGYIDPTALNAGVSHPQSGFTLQYDPEPAGEPCTVHDNPNEGCWRTGTPTQVKVSGTEVTLSSGEGELTQFDGQGYYASVWTALSIESNCNPSDVDLVGAVAYIVAVEE